MTLEMPKGPLSEADIRHIVREAETGMADGADAKELLVQATQNHIAAQMGGAAERAIHDIVEMAEAVGVDPDFAPLGEHAALAAKLYAEDRGPGAIAYQIAHAFVTAKPVLPTNRGKWLAKFGIVKEHIDAIGSPSAPTTPEAVASIGAPDYGAVPMTPPALDAIATPPIEIAFNRLIEAPDVTDPDMREMLGYAPLPGAEVPAAPTPFADAAPSAAAPPTAPTPDASSAAPGSHPPPTGTPRDAFLLVSQACTIEDAELAKRIGISRSTIHNYMSGRTARVKCDHAQARVMAAECDRRVALLRQAAEIFSQVRD